MGGGPLAVLDADPRPDRARGERAPVVLIPGYTGSKEDFLALLTPLAAAGHRALTYDQRGQFDSPGPENPAAFSVDRLAGDLLELLDALGTGPAHLVGHSFGGLVARCAVLRRPAGVRSLTLLDSGPAAVPGVRAQRIRELRPAFVAGGHDAVWARMAEFAVVDGAGTQPPTPPEVAEFLRRRFYGSCAAGLLAMGDALLAEPDRTDELRAVEVPLLVAYGERDDAWPPAIQAEMADRLGARHAVIPDAVHSPNVENPDALVRVLTAFFRDVERGL